MSNTEKNETITNLDVSLDTAKKDTIKTENDGTQETSKMGQLCYRIIATVLNVVFFGYFVMNKDALLGIGENFNKKYLLVTIVWMLGVMLAIYIKNFLSDRLNRIAAFLLCAGTPIFVVKIMNFVIGASPRGAIEWWYNCVIVAVFLVLFLLITNSMKAAPALTAIAGILFSVVNYFVYQFRGTPMLAADIFTAGTAANVLSDYTIQFNFRCFFALYIAVGFSIVVWRLRKTKLCNGWKVRTVFSICAIIFCSITSYRYVYGDVLDDVFIKLFNPMYSYRIHGPALTFVRSMNYIIIEEPDGYSLQVVEEIAEEYKEDSDVSGTNEDSNIAPGTAPNVITIVNEAFSDIAYAIPGIETNTDYMPFYHSLKENCIKGRAFVSVRGGQTANSEYEYLTANTIAFMPEGSVPFQIYVNSPMPSLTSILNEKGYSGSDAYHPFYPSGYKRTDVYPNLGFDQFYSYDYFRDCDRIGAHVSDSALYRKLEEDYEAVKKESPDQPYQQYTMTMQNHSPYNRDFTGLTNSITLEGEYYNAEQQNYVNLIKASDDALKELLDYYENVEEPTVIAFFGDHQERIKQNYINKVTNQEAATWEGEDMVYYRYCVPYLIWANYDIEEKENFDTSLNYLSGMVLDVAGQEKTGYQKFLSDMQEQVPAICALGYYGADGKFYEIEDETSPYYDWIQKYQYLQYNNTFDSDNRLDWFFYGKDAK